MPTTKLIMPPLASTITPVRLVQLRPPLLLLRLWLPVQYTRTTTNNQQLNRLQQQQQQQVTQQAGSMIN